jgi:hypothetical protein
LTLEPFDYTINDLVRRSEKIGTIASLSCPLDKHFKEIDARYALGHVDTEPPRAPDDALPIDIYDRAIVDGAHESGIILNRRELRDIDDDVLRRLAMLDYLVHGQQVDEAAEKSAPLLWI